MKIVLGIITVSDKVLIGKIRQDKIEEYGGMQYAFPNGEVAEGETSEEAIIKEFKIQSGLDIEVVNKIGEREHPIMHNWTEYFHCKLLTTQLIVQASKESDVEEFMWVNVNDISNYMPPLFQLVNDYLRAL